MSICVSKKIKLKIELRPQILMGNNIVNKGNLQVRDFFAFKQNLQLHSFYRIYANKQALKHPEQ